MTDPLLIEALLASSDLEALLAGKARKLTKAQLEEARRLPNIIRRAVRRLMAGNQFERAGSVDTSFDYDRLLDQLVRPVPFDAVTTTLSRFQDLDAGSDYLMAAERVRSHLAGKLPRRTVGQLIFTKVIKPDPITLARFRRTFLVAEHPLHVLAKARAGTLTLTDVTDLSTMYPAITDLIRTTVVAEAARLMARSQAWSPPYAKREPLARLLGIPSFAPQHAARLQQQIAASAEAETRRAQASAPQKSIEGLKTPFDKALEGG